MWEKKCWDQALAQRGDLERDEEAAPGYRAKEKRRRKEESKHEEEEERGGLGCLGRECVIKGTGEESFPTGLEMSERRDSLNPYQTPDRGG
jgi:hypothetical protein